MVLARGERFDHRGKLGDDVLVVDLAVVEMRRVNRDVEL
jgi:hypothetical protein